MNNENLATPLCYSSFRVTLIGKTLKLNVLGTMITLPTGTCVVINTFHVSLIWKPIMLRVLRYPIL